MLSTSWSLLSLFLIFGTVVKAQPHANPHGRYHHSRAVVPRASDATSDSQNSNIGIVYNDNSNLGAFSGKIGFSVDWSPTPLDSSNGLDLGTFIPQLWTFQDSNRESPPSQTYIRNSERTN